MTLKKFIIQTLAGIVSSCLIIVATLWVGCNFIPAIFDGCHEGEGGYAIILGMICNALGTSLISKYHQWPGSRVFLIAGSIAGWLLPIVAVYLLNKIFSAVGVYFSVSSLTGLFFWIVVFPAIGGTLGYNYKR